MPGFAYNGIHLVSWSSDEYALDAGRRAMDALAETNANWAGLLTTWYQADAKAAVIAPDLLKTPSDDALRFAMGHLHALGLRVMLKPHVDGTDGSWRGQFCPENVDDWFLSYRRFITHYAALAEECGAEMFAVGTELSQLSKGPFRRQWIELISEVRTHFGGLITYAANGAHANDEFTSVSFWDAVDLIGVDAYFPVDKGWKRHAPALKRLSDEYEKPLIFTEIGYRSCAGAAAEPWNWPTQGPVDLDEQERCYAAFFDAWSRGNKWMQGAFWWNWPAADTSERNTDYTPRAKPAGQILASHFSPSPETARARRVRSIRERIASGAYQVDPLAVSRALIRHHTKED